MPFHKGQKAWNKGKKGLVNSGGFKIGHKSYWTEKTKKIMSKKMKRNTNGFKKKQIPWNKNRKWTKDEKEKIKEGIKNKFPNGRKLSEKHLKAISGNNNKKWKGGISKLPNYGLMMVHKRRIKKTNNGGSHTQGDWQTLKAQYNWTCPCCKRKEPEIKLTIDHIIPISKGGSNNIENIQPLCGKCNSKKNTKIFKFKK